MFKGFYRPKSNFYRLPNDWFDVWADVRRMSGRSRILALLKIVEYIIKWTWGYQNYDEPIRISRRDFQRGRLKGHQRLDRGTRLSSRSVESALKLLIRLGLIQETHEAGDDGPSFIPRLRSEDEDPPGFLYDVSNDVSDDASENDAYQGFDLPTANYFLVPALWTDLSSEVSSETTILSVEYFFRHTWGWKDGWDEPCWMDAEDIANGRRYLRSDARYDRGIGYSVKCTRDGLNDAVNRGWLTWRYKEDGQGREYALHLKGMEVAEDGRFLTPENDEYDEYDAYNAPNEYATERAAAPPPPSTPQPPASLEKEAEKEKETETNTAHTIQITRLQAQVDTLTRMVEALIALLHEAGIDISDVAAVVSKGGPDGGNEGENEGGNEGGNFVLDTEGKQPTEQSTAAREDNTADREETTARQEGNYSTYYTDTDPDTGFKTPPPNTRAHPTHAGKSEDAGDSENDKSGGGGGDSIQSSSSSSSSSLASLVSLIERLTALETPMSPDAASELISRYGEGPVRAWLNVLERDPSVRNLPGLLIHKLRNGERPPATPSSAKPASKAGGIQPRGHNNRSQRGRVVTLEEMPEVAFEEPLPLPK